MQRGEVMWFLRDSFSASQNPRVLIHVAQVYPQHAPGTLLALGKGLSLDEGGSRSGLGLGQARFSAQFSWPDSLWTGYSSLCAPVSSSVKLAQGCTCTERRRVGQGPGGLTG